MSTLIFVDNGEPGLRGAPKDVLKLGSGIKTLDKKLQLSTPRVGKTFNAPTALPKTGRKALGTVNRATEKHAKTHGPLKQKHAAFTVTKITEKTVKAKSSAPASDDAYPEIEFFPYDPLAFESFDLVEEHQIARLLLSGVPLMMLDEERRLEKLLNLDPPSPMKVPFPPWDSNHLLSPSSILSSLDVDLPPVCYDLDM